MLNYDEVKGFCFAKAPSTYTSRDSILYALALGFGEDPLDERQLRYVTETGQCVAPTMPVVFCHPGFWIKEPKLGIDWRKFVHLGQQLTLTGALKPAGTIVSNTANVVVADRGAARGAIIVQRRELSDEASGQVVAVIESTYLARGDGGFSADNGRADPLPDTASVAAPDGAADVVLELKSLPQSALLYRLSGDYNPLHSSPSAAATAGFPRPILHGLCTYGIAARAVLSAFCDYDATRLRSLSARFTAPVFPGEILRFEMTRSGGSVHFQARVPDREAVVLKDGCAVIA